MLGTWGPGSQSPNALLRSEGFLGGGQVWQRAGKLGVGAGG